MNPTTSLSHSATIPMQLRCRKQRKKSFSHQGNSKLSDSIASTSGMSRRIIQRMCVFSDRRRSELIEGLLPCRPVGSTREGEIRLGGREFSLGRRVQTQEAESIKSG